MRRFSLILFCLTVLLAVTACTHPQPDMATSSVENTTVSTSPPQTTAPVETTIPVESSDNNSVYEDYYAGKPSELMTTYEEYAYRYQGRNRDWEEDVVFMANALFETHPVLKDGYSRIKAKDGAFVWVNLNEYYDGDLRALIISDVEQLLERIPALQDYEIAMEMRRILALLSDVHTGLYTVPDSVLPVGVELIEKDGRIGLYVVQAPMQHVELLFCELTVINGYAVEDVINLLKPYEPDENVYGQVGQIVERGLICDFGALCAVGVADAEAKSAVLTFLDQDGQEFTVELLAVPYELADMVMVKMDYYSNRIGLHARRDEENYWYEEWTEENALYFRIVACMERTDYSFDVCCKDILAALDAAQTPMRLIIDLRHNGGGYYPLQGLLDFAVAVNKTELDGVYILTDSHCYSATTYFAAYFDEYIQDAVFIGTPLGQTYAFFAGAEYSRLPNSNWWLAVSTVYTNRMPELADTTFMPDIVLYPNWEDYKNGIDTLIKTALSDGRAVVLY